MLLTSAQVSFAVSTSVILLCTAALFLSGYVIQQRTLRDLRAAIRPTPRVSPKIFLPDRFKQSTTELEDGTVIAVDDPYDSRTRPAAAVEVKPTPPQQPDSAAPELRQQPIDANTDTGETDASQQKLPTKTAPEHDAHAQKTKTKKKKTKPARSRWWPYKQKKDAAASADEDKDADDKDSQKPISRAERRRRIRADIQKLSQGSQRGYYQRRLY
ncbi:hypothetical protein B0T26DRAFT_681188 [Lasiosphaeria miniovina]|uniref:Uncharacterized protein n=1 Tax=Lasiosphaeria miniovina TaxID=1954250 RepID=A0AA39ZTP2_9PEZI|nr:uncharacterized protein B0T26DRAFT_681188 [Lasiosphaeria miniovina]KAK0703529.1 hypothetical protein B0T26DRAFT_681188 [Lasiosphaeria miniovina]